MRPTAPSVAGRVAAVLQWNGLLPAACAAAVVFGVAYSIHLGDVLKYPDERDYLELARNLADHGRFALDGDLTASRSPGYPFFLAPFVLLGADVVVLRILSSLCLAATGLAVAALIRPWVPPPWPGLAGTAAVLYPLSLYTAGTLYAQVPATLALVVALVLLQAAVRPEGGPTGRDVATAAGAGLLLGVTTMMIPNHSFSALVAVVWGLWVAGPSRRWLLAVVVVGAAVLPAAWTVRNLAAFDEFVPLASNSGNNLLLGNNENARPNSGVNVDISQYQREARGLDEFEEDRHYQRAAIDWIRDHPGDAAALYAAKVANYFNFRNELYIRSEGSALRDAVAAVSYLPLVAILAVRLVLLRRLRPSRLEVLLLALYLLNAPFMAIFTTRIRYRLPFDVLLMAELALFGAAVVASRRSRSAARDPALSGSSPSGSPAGGSS